MDPKFNERCTDELMAKLELHAMGVVLSELPVKQGEYLTALLQELNMEFTLGDCCNATGFALEKIKALKHIAFVIAAYGDCHCDPRDVENRSLCVYCTAVQVTDAMKPSTDSAYMYAEPEP